MNSKRKPYKTYTKEFKVEAVRLMNASNIPSSELAAQLGVRRNQLYKWKAQLEDKGDKAFSNNLGRPREENQSELVTLRQENERLKEEVEILKKAAAYFARELK
jgi:transposase|tara:strand:+ start:1786 stop:2097 length:312 start_codon:yes stop_codon:yes gene_type:complete